MVQKNSNSISYSHVTSIATINVTINVSVRMTWARSVHSRLRKRGTAVTYVPKPVARSGKGGVRKIKKCGPKVGVGHQKGGGGGRAGGGMCPIPRFARNLLKTLIWQHKRINSLQTHVNTHNRKINKMSNSISCDLPR